MKKRFTEEQIVRIFQEVEKAGSAREVIRKRHISEQSFYRWKNKYSGVDVVEDPRAERTGCRHSGH